MNRRTVSFTILQGFYWITACVIYTFSERFLTAYGFSVSQVGIVTAAANIFSLLLQPFFAELADRKNGLSLKAGICLLMSLSVLFAVIVFAGSSFHVVIAVFFCSLSTVTLTVQPMVNSVGFHYIDRGEPLDYSLARGIASGVFAVFCYLAGYLAERNVDSLLWAYILGSAGIFVTALAFAPDRTQRIAETALPSDTIALVRRNAYLLFFLPGMVLVFIPHNFINTYMLSIVGVIGRGTHEMSTAIALAAIVEIPTMCGFSLIHRRFRLNTLLLFSALAFLIKHLLLLLPLFLSLGVWSVYLSQCLQMFGYALFIPASSFFINERMEDADMVKGQMLLTEAITLSCILGQFLGGYGISRIGVPRSMLIGCGLSVLGFLLILIGIRRSQPASLR